MPEISKKTSPPSAPQPYTPIVPPTSPWESTLAYQAARTGSAFKFSLVGNQVGKGGMPVLGKTLSAIPTAAFGLAEHIANQSRFSDAAVDLGVEIGQKFLPKPLQWAIHISEFAAKESDRTPEYMALFPSDSEDEMDRWAERGMISAMGGLAYAKEGVKAGLTWVCNKLTPEERVSSEKATRGGSFFNNYDTNTYNSSASFKGFPDQPPSGFGLSSGFSYSPGFGYSPLKGEVKSEHPSLVPPQLPFGREFKQERKEGSFSGEREQKSTDEKPFASFPQQSSTPKAKEIIPDLPRVPQQTSDSSHSLLDNLGKIVVTAGAVPGGFQVGVVSTDNALGVNVGVRFQAQGLDKLITTIVNNYFSGDKGREHNITLYGEKYTYRIDTEDGGSNLSPHAGVKCKLIVKHVSTGTRIEKSFRLEKVGIYFPELPHWCKWLPGLKWCRKKIREAKKENRDTLKEVGDKGLNEAVIQVFSIQHQQFAKQCNQLLSSNLYTEAEKLSAKFFDQYAGPPGMEQQKINDNTVIADGKKNFQLQQLMDEASIHLKAGRETEAIKLYLTAQEMQPGHVLSSLELAKIYIKNGQWEEAIGAGEKMQKSFSDNAEISTFVQDLKLRQLAEIRTHINALVEAEQYSVAQDELDHLLRLDPSLKNQAAYFAHKAALFGVTEQPDQVAAAYQQAYQALEDWLASNPTPSAQAEGYVQKAEILKQEGRSDEAILAYQKAQASVPNHNEATTGLANLYIEKEELPKAITEMKKLATPENKEASALVVSLEKRYRANTLVKEGEQLKNEGNHAGAEKKFQEAQAEEANHVGAAFALAKLYSENSDYAKAIQEVKKVPGQEAYLAELKCYYLTGQIDPFLRALATIANHYLQAEGGSKGVQYALRVVLALHHVHPQFWLAAPGRVYAHVMNDLHSKTAWDKLLMKRFEASSFSSGLFLANSLLAGTQVLGLERYIPFHRDLVEGVGYVQQGYMVGQLVNDIKVWKAISHFNLAHLDVANAIRTYSLGFAVPMLVSPLAEWVYDKLFHPKLLPETKSQCIKRDMVPIVVNILGSLLMPPPVALANAGANLLLPIYKALRGISGIEAESNLLENARRLLLESDPNKKNQGHQRYQQLPATYEQERLFVEEALREKTLLSYIFSLQNEPGKVNVGLASRLLSPIVLETGFETRSAALQNSWIQALRQMSSIPLGRGSWDLMTAKEAYAGSVAKRGFLNTATEHLESALQEGQIAYQEMKDKRLIRTKIWDQLISWGVFNFLNEGSEWYHRPTTSTHGAEVHLEELRVQTDKAKEGAARFSAGDFNSSFGYLLIKAAIQRREQAEGTNSQELKAMTSDEIHLEFQMIKVLSYLYADHIIINSTEKEILSIQKAVSILIEIQVSTSNAQLRKLALMLQGEILSFSSKNNTTVLAKIYATQPQTQVAQLAREKGMEKIISELRQAHQEEASAEREDSAELVDFMECFFALARDQGRINDRLLSRVIREFIKPSSGKTDQFQYAPEVQERQEDNLVALYLSGMLAFMGLLKTLLQDPLTSSSISLFQKEILDHVLLRGYLPPFGTMMVRLTGRYLITEAQGKALLSWYVLDRSEQPAYEKMRLLLVLYRSPYFSEKRETTTLGELCRVWGTLVRQTLFSNAGNYTEQLHPTFRYYYRESQAFDSLQKLLKQGADPNYRKSGKSLLHAAVEKEWPRVTELLCQYGAQVDFSWQGLTPLHLAAVCYKRRPSANLVSIEAILGRYGAVLTQRTELSWFWSPFLWWWYRNQTAEEMLKPQVQEGKLGDLKSESLSVDTALFRLTGNTPKVSRQIPSVQDNSEEFKLIQKPRGEMLSTNEWAETTKLLGEQWQKTRLPYDFSSVYHLLTHYFEEAELSSFPILPVSSLLEWLDQVKLSGGQLTPGLIIAFYQNHWEVLYFPLVISQEAQFICSNLSSASVTSRSIARLLGSKVSIRHPQIAVEEVDSGPWIVEEIRLILFGSETSPGRSLWRLRWHVHMPLLREMEAKANKEKIHEIKEERKEEKLPSLYRAACEGDLSQLQEIWQEDPLTLQEVSEEGLQPLHYAAKYLQSEIVAWLIGTGASVINKSGAQYFERTPLHFAVGAVDVAKWNSSRVDCEKLTFVTSSDYCQRVTRVIGTLVLNGADCLIPDSLGQSARDLAIALRIDLEKVIDTYLEDRRNKRRRLFELSKSKELTSEDESYLEIVRQNPGLLTPPTENRNRHFVIQSVASGNVDFLGYLLELKPNWISIRTLKNNFNLFHIATGHLHQKVMQLLLAKAPHLLKERDREGHTPLEIFLEKVATQAVSPPFLKEAVLGICSNSEVDFTLVERAIQFARGLSQSILGPILSDMERLEHNTRYFLKFAEESSFDENGEAALRALGGVYLERQDPVDGCLAIHKAAARGNQKLVAYLIRQQPEALVAVSKTGMIPLHYACQENRSFLVRYFLFLAQEYTMPGLYEELLLSVDQQGRSALDHALASGYGQLYQDLLFHYGRCLPENKLYSWLEKHLDLALGQGKWDIALRLIVRVGITSASFESFIEQCVRKMPDESRIQLWNQVLNARDKGKINEKQLKAFKTSLKVEPKYYQEFSKQQSSFSVERPIPQDEEGWHDWCWKKHWIYKRSLDGSMAVHQIAQQGDQLLSILRALIYQDAELLRVKKANHWIPLDCAVAALQPQAVEFLLPQTPELVNVRIEGDPHGNTLLLLAIEQFGSYKPETTPADKVERLKSVIELLGACGANPDLPNREGNLPEDLIKKQNLPLDFSDIRSKFTLSQEGGMPSPRSSIPARSVWGPGIFSGFSEKIPFCVPQEEQKGDGNQTSGSTFFSRENIEGREIDAGGAGDCFFRAVAYELKRQGLESLTPEDLRAQAVQYLRERPVIFDENTIAGLPEQDKGDVAKYLKRMSCLGEYAEGPIIQALGMMLNVVLVITHDREEGQLTHRENSGEDRRGEIHLILRGRGEIAHYSVLVPPQKKVNEGYCSAHP